MSDEGDMLICPYNRSHVVSKLRMGRHLVKCQANHPNIHLATCFYDFLHRVPPAELDEHLETCPSKALFQVHFSMGEKPSDESDHNVGKIFLTRNNLKLGKEEDAGKTPERGGYERPSQSFTYTENEGKKTIPKSSTMVTSPTSNTPVSKMTSSHVPKKGISTNSPFLLKCSIGNPKESKGKDKKEIAKKASKAKEESWDTDSSEDSPEEAKEKALTSSITTGKNDDSGSTHTGGNNRFQGYNCVDEDGFITVHSKRRSMK